jgi:HlyD family secretion protein
MPTELNDLRIDRSTREPAGPRWARIWILAGVGLFAFASAWLAYSKLNAGVEVAVTRVKAISSAAAGPGVILNATGYIVAAHKIEVTSKVVGKVAWIGVDKGDKVKQGQVVVRLEDDEYRAQLLQAHGQLAALQAKLREAQAGSRPEEIAGAKADLEQARADLVNARVNLDRTRKLVEAKISAPQTLDDAQARYDGQVARVDSLQKRYDLTILGPRQEEIDSLRGQVEQAQGAVNYYETLLENTVIRAPVTGTILERAVEKGEFVTTNFVGDRGAKGYVVSLADLNDLEVELDINQNDFAKLGPRQKGTVTTDAFPDRKYQGFIKEISPEANRQKATVQVKVKVENPDDYLRPEMNASVAFYSDTPASSAAAAQEKPVILAPSSSVHEGAVFVVLGDKAVRRAVKTGAVTGENVRIEEGLIGGEDLIVNPPQTLKDGDKVKVKQG